MILIIKTGALGDVLRTTALLKPLLEKYHEPIWWLTSPEAAPLLKGHPAIFRVVTSASALSRRFDLVLSLEEDTAIVSRAGEICRGRWVGVRLKDGVLSYTADSAPYYAMSLLNKGRGDDLSRADKLKRANKKTYAEIWLGILGLPIPKNRDEMRPLLLLNAADRRAALSLAARRFITPGKAVGFNPGAGTRWPSKALSENQARAMAEALSFLRRPVLVLGGQDEKERNRRIVRGLGGVVAPAPVGLRSFAGLIELCEVVVTTDSLAFHMATALAKKVVVLVGPTSASELDVYGLGAKVLPKKGCDCFYKKNCVRKAGCLDQIPAGEIVGAVRSLIR